MYCITRRITSGGPRLGEKNTVFTLPFSSLFFLQTGLQRLELGETNTKVEHETSKTSNCEEKDMERPQHRY